MEYKNVFSPLKTRIKLNDSLWISVRFLLILELLNKDYTANAFVCEKLKALYLMLNKH
jgi:hypothetical protein